MSKSDDAVTIRDIALDLVRRHGVWEKSQGPRLLLAQFGDIQIAHHTPFQISTQPSEEDRHSRALVGGRANLPYGLDVWAPKKVFNVEWDDSGAFAILGFRRGGWECDLKLIARNATGLRVLQ